MKKGVAEGVASDPHDTTTQFSALKIDAGSSNLLFGLNQGPNGGSGVLLKGWLGLNSG